jgi:hypothetical protein
VEGGHCRTCNGFVFADDKKIYSADSLKVGLFK